MRATQRARSSWSLLRANTTFLERPDRLPRALLAAQPYGTGLLAAVAASAARYPNVAAVIGDDEMTTYRELWSGSGVLAAHLTEMGVGPEQRVGVLCRNSHWFVYGVVAAARIGADIVLLNTSFGPEQLQDTVSAEEVDVLVHDDEFEGFVGGTSSISVSQLAQLFEAPEGNRRVGRPVRRSRLVVLTSGTTGRPKGASRGSGGAETEGVASLLERIPLRLRDTIVVPAPFFHAWGLGGLLIGLGLSATVVTSRRFDPATALELVDRHRAEALIVVPTMLQRVCALPPQELARFETRSLRVIASSGSALPARLATEVLDRFGPVLHNVYGSTEVATATIATPRDLRVAPTTSGRPASGVRVAILDPEGSPVDVGTTGRVFVGNAARFAGYTGGGSKEVVDGLLSTGDLAHFDRRGRLFLDGREDDMIVSGGENVYPTEVENLLNEHPDIEEAVVVGVEDESFGNALKAVVVLREGRTADADHLKAYVTERLARYKVPRAFVFIDALPRTATGKVRKRELV